VGHLRTSHGDALREMVGHGVAVRNPGDPGQAVKARVRQLRRQRARSNVRR